MSTTSRIDKQVTKTMRLSIIPTSAEVDLNTAVWAINWFDTKRKWLYNIYTFLASPMVLKVGGGLWFKGEYVKKLKGEEKYARKILLIVKYPSVHKFFGLMDFKFFLLISLLRVKAVEQFVFGFTQRIKIDRPVKDKKAKGSPCLVHHFRGNKNYSKNIQSLASAAAKKGITLVYAGMKAATLQRTVEEKGTVDIPFFMDGIMVFEGNNKDVLAAFYKSDVYQNVVDAVEDSYIAIFKKIS